MTAAATVTPIPKTPSAVIKTTISTAPPIAITTPTTIATAESSLAIPLAATLIITSTSIDLTKSAQTINSHQYYHVQQ